MVMAVNNAALLGGQAVVDSSGWTDQFRDGQKLRQEYDARQQTKALNELMGIEDFNERISKARTHKYAGALVPELQKYEEARQKAVLDNLGASADIGKTYAETGKLGAESGKISAESQGQGIKNVLDSNNVLANSAAGLNKPLLFNTIGQLFKAGVYDANTTQNLLKLAKSDDPNDIAVLKQIAMTNPDLAKLFQPKSEVLDAKDGAYLYTNDPWTGQANDPTAKIGYGVSPDNQLDNDTSRLNNQNTVAGSMYNSDNSLKGTMYSSDNSYNASTFATETASQDRRLKLNQDGQIEWAKVSQAQQKLDNPVSSRKQIPPSAMKAMGEFQENLVNNAHTMKENAKWIKNLESGELQLGAVKNFNNTFAARTGITSAGSNPGAYAEFNAYIKDLANKALRLNAGVQTDADYKRMLESIVAGANIPRDNGIAVGLLNRIHKDFDSQNRAIYQNLISYKKEYAGVDLPNYGQGSSTPKQKAKSNQGASIIGGILGGK